MSIHFTYKGKATLLQVTGLCLVSPPPPFHFCHGPVTLGAGLETRFLIRDNYHGLYGLQAAVVPPPPRGTCPCGTCPECPLGSQQPS